MYNTWQVYLHLGVKVEYNFQLECTYYTHAKKLYEGAGDTLI